MPYSVDNIIASHGLGPPFYDSYTDICGKKTAEGGASDGYLKAREKFSSLVDGSALKFLTNASDPRRILLPVWHSLLLSGDGCAERTEGRDRARMRRQADPRQRPSVMVAPYADGGLLVSTPKGNALLGYPKTILDVPPSLPGVDVVIPEDPFTPDSGKSNVPQLFRRARVGGEIRDFLFVLEAGALTLVRNGHFTVDVFIDGKFGDKVSLVETLTDESSYIAAWNRYLQEPLRGIPEILELLKDFSAHGWDGLSADQKGWLASELTSLQRALEESAAFLIATPGHPLQGTFAAETIAWEQARFSRDANLVGFVLNRLARQSITAVDIDLLQEALGSFIDPMSFLAESSAMAHTAHASVNIDLPQEQSAIHATRPIALQRVLHEIIDRAVLHVDHLLSPARGTPAGGTPETAARLSVEVQRWEEQKQGPQGQAQIVPKARIVVKDESVGLDALAPFFPNVDSTDSQSPRSLLEQIARTLGEGSDISFTPRREGEQPAAIAITVPLAPQAAPFHSIRDIQDPQVYFREWQGYLSEVLAAAQQIRHPLAQLARWQARGASIPEEKVRAILAPLSLLFENSEVFRRAPFTSLARTWEYALVQTELAKLGNALAILSNATDIALIVQQLNLLAEPFDFLVHSFGVQNPWVHDGILIEVPSQSIWVRPADPASLRRSLHEVLLQAGIMERAHLKIGWDGEKREMIFSSLGEAPSALQAFADQNGAPSKVLQALAHQMSPGAKPRLTFDPSSGRLIELGIIIPHEGIPAPTAGGPADATPAPTQRSFKRVVVDDGAEALIQKVFAEALGPGVWEGLKPEQQQALVAAANEYADAFQMGVGEVKFAAYRKIYYTWLARSRSNLPAILTR